MNSKNVAISALVAAMVLPACHVTASNDHNPNANESIGRKWHVTCRKKAKKRDKNSGITSLNNDIFIACCQGKVSKCNDEAINTDERMACEERVQSCFNYNYKKNNE